MIERLKTKKRLFRTVRRAFT